MIDELSLGLAPTIVGQLLDVVRDRSTPRGTTIVIVEQSVNVALTLAERAVFMEKGEVRFAGPTAELLERPDILRSVFIRQGPQGPRPAAGGRRPRNAAANGRCRPTRRPARAGASSSASAASPPSTTSTSTCARARSSGSSATTAPARPR